MSVESIGVSIAAWSEGCDMLEDMMAHMGTGNTDIEGLYHEVMMRSRAIGIDARELSDGDMAAISADLTAVEARTARIKHRYTAMHNRMKRATVIAQHLQEPDNPIEPLPDETAQAHQQRLVAKGDKVQEDTQDALNRIARAVDNTEQIGAAIQLKMDEQTEQLYRIRGDLDDVQYNLQRAKQTMRALAKNAVGDRCMQILCFFIFVFGVSSVVLLAL